MPFLKPFLQSTVVMAIVLSGAHGAIAENISQVQQLLSTKKCPSCDLTSAGLVLAKLPGADLTGANLAGANFSQANLAGANLSGANLVGIGLAGANLTGANLRNANLIGADLRGAYLTGADLTGAQINNTNFRSAIDLPPSIGTAEEFYLWAMEAGQQKRYELSLDYFKQAIIRQPNYAAAHLGRGMSQWQLGNAKESLQDIDRAAELFKTQGDTANAEATRKIAVELRKPVKDEQGKGGNGMGPALLGLAGSLLRIFIGL
jgi:uncharacterized protein YjbI with pentapeptide repeats